MQTVGVALQDRSKRETRLDCIFACPYIYIYTCNLKRPCYKQMLGKVPAAKDDEGHQH